MSKAKDAFMAKYGPCAHFHISGRRCGNQVLRSSHERYCNLHRFMVACAECAAMQRAFVPPKGW